MICQAGMCVPALTIATEYIELATEDHSTNLMIVTGDTLLWAYPTYPRTITRVATDGGTPVDLVQLTDGPVGIAADATTVYWTSYDGVAERGAIKSMPLDGGAEGVLATTPAGFPTAIAVDATHAYWVEQPADPSQPRPLRVLTSPLTGGVPVELARSSAATFTYKNPIKDYGLVFDATGVYWTNQVDRTIEVVPTDGGSSTVLASGVGLSSSLAVAADRVFFVDTVGLQMVDLASGKGTTVAANANRHETVATDHLYVYFVIDGDDGASQLWRAPFDGGSAELIAGDMPPIWSVAIDDENIFLNVESCGGLLGQILKLKKP